MLSEEEMENYELFKNHYLQQPISLLTKENLELLEKHCKKAIHYERKDGILEHQITLDLLYKYEEQQAEIEKKDKTIEAMRYIKNTSRYEDTILIDEDKVNHTRRNKFLIELNNGEFIEVNTLKAKANKYDSLVEKIEEKLKKCENLIDASQGCMNDEDLYREYGKREILQELSNTEKPF